MFASLIAACGGGDSSPDARVITTPDARVTVDAGPQPCTNDLATIPAFTLPAVYFAPGDPAMDTVNETYVAIRVEEEFPTDVIIYSIYQFGIFEAGYQTGTFPISGDEASFDTCAICGLMLTQYMPGANGGNATWADEYFATSGSATLNAMPTAVDEPVDFTTNFTTVHVDIDNAGVTTPVGDGCQTVWEGMTFAGTASAVPSAATNNPYDWNAIRAEMKRRFKK